MEVMRTSAVELDAVLVVVVTGGPTLFGCARSGAGAAGAPMVSHWAFPKSQGGGLAVSYPFVFVGG
jgi:hypothetical protein